MSSVNPSTFAQNVTFTATVSPAAATGTVTFNDGANTLGSVALASGMAAFSTTTLSAAAHSITVIYSGDANDATSASAALTQTVNLTPTTITLTSAPNPSRIGQAVTLTAMVSPAAATGTVTFNDGATSLGTGTLVGGVATLTTSSLALGTHTLTAAYGGDANDAASVSAPGPALNFTSAVPGTILDSTGAGTGFTTRLSGTGTTYFANDPNLTLNTGAGTLTVNSVATDLNGQINIANGEFVGFPLSAAGVTLNEDFSLSVTFRNIQFGLSADQIGLFAGTSSANAVRGGVLVAGSPEAYTIATVGGADQNPGASVALAPSPGDDVIFTLSRTSGTWAFMVQNLTTPANSGAVPITQPVNLNGVAGLMAGIYASNAGNATVRTETVSSFSFSAGVQSVIPLTSTTTTLMSSLNPSMPGQSVTVTATVAPATATGTVTFMDGANMLGTGPLSGGTTTFSTSALTTGMHSLTAVYSGDANDASSTSAALTQTVLPTATSTTLMSSLNPSVFAQNVTFTATVSPAAATGTVTFKDGANTLGAGGLAGGMATFSTAALSVAAHSITAVYGGDTNDTASTSAAFTQTVNQAATTTTLMSSVNPSSFGQGVTLTATVAPATATGTVTFKDGATTLGSSPLASGMTTFSTDALSVAAHSITAIYSGDTNDLSSTSAVFTQTVNQAATTTTVTSSVNPSTFGQSVTLTATVAPATATGTITFKDGATTLGSSALAGGMATFGTAVLSVAAHSITAVYGGDTNDAASTSVALTQTVNQGATTTALMSSLNPSTFGQNVTLTATVAPAAATGSSDV